MGRFDTIALYTEGKMAMATTDFEIRQLLKAYRKELLRSLIDDERSSFKWLQETCETMSAARPGDR